MSTFDRHILDDKEKRNTRLTIDLSHSATLWTRIGVIFRNNNTDGRNAWQIFVICKENIRNLTNFIQRLNKKLCSNTFVINEINYTPIGEKKSKIGRPKNIREGQTTFVYLFFSIVWTRI